MKKIAVGLVVFTLLISQMLGASLAVNNEESVFSENRALTRVLEVVSDQRRDVVQKNAALAYMDISSAPASMRGDILQARKSIIYCTSWVNDLEGSYRCTVVDADGNFVAEVPKFSELFPGWEPPVESTETHLSLGNGGRHI